MKPRFVFARDVMIWKNFAIACVELCRNSVEIV